VEDPPPAEAGSADVAAAAAAGLAASLDVVEAIGASSGPGTGLPAAEVPSAPSGWSTPAPPPRTGVPPPDAGGAPPSLTDGGDPALAPAPDEASGDGVAAAAEASSVFGVPDSLVLSLTVRSPRAEIWSIALPASALRRNAR
jgi:hypothetical protein